MAQIANPDGSVTVIDDATGAVLATVAPQGFGAVEAFTGQPVDLAGPQAPEAPVLERTSYPGQPMAIEDYLREQTGEEPQLVSQYGMGLGPIPRDPKPMALKRAAAKAEEEKAAREEGERQKGLGFAQPSATDEEGKAQPGTLLTDLDTEFDFTGAAQPSKPAMAGARAQMKAIEEETDAKVQEQLAREDEYRQGVEDEQMMLSMMDEQEVEMRDQADLYRQKREEFGKVAFDMGVDPQRFYKNQSSFQKIATAIGVALGAFVHEDWGYNPAMRIIEDAINKDIAAQEKDIAQARGKYQHYTSLAQEANRNLKDFRLSRPAMIAEHWKQVDRMMEAQAAKFVAPQIKARGDQARAAIQDKIDAAEQAYAMNAAKAIRESVRKKAWAEGRLPVHMLTPEEKREGYVTVPGAGPAVGATEAREANQMVTSATKIMSHIEELRKIYDQHGQQWTRGIIGTPEEAAAVRKAKSLSHAIITELTSQRGLGAISEGDKKILNAILDDPTKFDITSTGREMLNTVDDIMLRETDASIETATGKPNVFSNWMLGGTRARQKTRDVKKKEAGRLRSGE